MQTREAVEKTDAGESVGQTRLVALVFTDVVESTALKHKLGDQAGSDLIERHHALVRQVLATFREGEEIETAGDSFLLLFTKPSSSVKFALLLQARLSQWNEEITWPVLDRIGIHSGEIVVRESDDPARSKRLRGLQVDIAARLVSLAQGGQILLTRAVFDNARQVLKGEEIPGLSPLVWLNYGPFLFKGIDDPVEVCEVSEIEPPPCSRSPDQRKSPSPRHPRSRADFGLASGRWPGCAQHQMGIAPAFR